MIRYRYTLEGRPDKDGKFWIRRNGVRVLSCPSRVEARQIIVACEDGDPASASAQKPQINVFLRTLIDQHGIQTVRDHMGVLDAKERLAVNNALMGMR
jgi:hypothetical protein